MLKLKGHPPVLMRRPDGDQVVAPFARTFSKVCLVRQFPRPFQFDYLLLGNFQRLCRLETESETLLQQFAEQLSYSI
jgi:hypothetical protein